MGRIFAMYSGSGGVGKSTLALSLAVGSAKAGRRTVLLDASGISRSCDLTLGMESIVVLDMADVISEQASLDAALYRVPRRDNLCFACASLYDNLPSAELTGIFLALHSMCDVLVIDLPTGRVDLGEGILCAGDERIVITRPDDVSIRSAERVIASFSRDEAGVSVVINRVRRERGRRGRPYDAQAVQMVLDRPILGSIPEDESIGIAEQRGRCALECDGPARSSISVIVNSLLNGV